MTMSDEVSEPRHKIAVSSLEINSIQIKMKDRHLRLHENVLTPWMINKHWYTFRHHAFSLHDDVIKWKHYPRYWPFVRGIHRSPVNSQHKGQRRGALMFSFICVWINGWVNNREADNLRYYRAHYGVTVMSFISKPRMVNGLTIGIP